MRLELRLIKPELYKTPASNEIKHNFINKFKKIVLDLSYNFFDYLFLVSNQFLIKYIIKKVQ